MCARVRRRKIKNRCLAIKATVGRGKEKDERKKNKGRKNENVILRAFAFIFFLHFLDFARDNGSVKEETLDRHRRVIPRDATKIETTKTKKIKRENTGVANEFFFCARSAVPFRLHCTRARERSSPRVARTALPASRALWKRLFDSKDISSGNICSKNILCVLKRQNM